MMPGLLALRPLTSANKLYQADERNAVAASPVPEKSNLKAQLQGNRMPYFHEPNYQATENCGFRQNHVDSERPLRLFDAPMFDQFKRFSACSGISSGSEHEPSTLCLSEMVEDFMQEDQIRGVPANQPGPNACKSCGNARCGGACGFDDDEEEDTLGIQELLSAIQDLSLPSNSMEHCLLADVSSLVTKIRSANGLCGGPSSTFIRRSIMASLRSLGYNAAVCKSRWEHSKSLPGGDYEYVDVVYASTVNSPLSNGCRTPSRSIVDVDFRAQFEIARPTPRYAQVVAALPLVFVGRADRLQQLVGLVSDAARASIRKQGMHLPPWRRLEYMRSKWLAPYKRTTNEVPCDVAGAVAISLSAASPVGIFTPAGAPARLSVATVSGMDECVRGGALLAPLGVPESRRAGENCASQVQKQQEQLQEKPVWQPVAMDAKMCDGVAAVSGLSAQLKDFETRRQQYYSQRQASSRGMQQLQQQQQLVYQR